MLDVSNLKFKEYKCSVSGGKDKLWYIAYDNRGIHTFYSHPDTLDTLVYYHKPIDELPNLAVNQDQALIKYVNQKENEKLRKGYIFIKSDAVYDINTNTLA
ncbi:hypothetical protein C5F64_14775 [Photobacterium damselae subsp. damselae]|nr:hypothetical protein BST98_21090 [Photobacterium damselae]PSB83332.1 hypothetical protein C5F64_14775 [Photobacterium damselae subsp. damselae]